MLKFIATKLDTLGYRLHLIDEFYRLRRAGRELPGSLLRDLFRSPLNYDDFLQFLCFFGNREKLSLIDIGANEGSFTRDFLKFFPRIASVSCFEPNPAPFARLTANLADVENVSFFNVGIGEREEELDFHVPDSDVNGGLYRHNTLSGNHYEDREGDSIRVRIAPLDSFALELTAPAICKIDTQGHELAVLKGARATLVKFQAVLLECSFAPEYDGVDVSFSACCEILAGCDLYPVVFQRYGDAISTYAFERDVLFVKKALLGRIYHQNY